MRPDRIVVGEIRSGEALDLIQAMTSGHGGCLSTVHASYPKDTINRLETLALMSDVELPLVALRAQLASAIDCIVQTSRLADGSRCITHVSEVLGLDPSGNYEIAHIFERHYDGRDANGNIISTLLATGNVPTCHHQIQNLGLQLPSSVMTPR